ncbi:hypothetical protein LSAT2_021740 [Lamellibrachia satsuma]|nr:hypothetical protein LSAT2_021740 [Lamellibrachia satsuma]
MSVQTSSSDSVVVLVFFADIAHVTLTSAAVDVFYVNFVLASNFCRILERFVECSACSDCFVFSHERSRHPRNAWNVLPWTGLVAATVVIDCIAYMCASVSRTRGIQL